MLSPSESRLFSQGPDISRDGTLTFTLSPDCQGTSVVSVALMDDGGRDNGGEDLSLVQSFTIVVDPVNDAPSFVKGSDVKVLEDAGPTSLSDWATALSSGPAKERDQSLTFEVSTDAPELFSAGPALDTEGQLSFTPAENLHGQALVTVVLRDNGERRHQSKPGPDLYPDHRPGQ
jgi:hypothetical protein